MAVYDLYLLADEDLSQDWEGAEYSREGGAPIDDPVRQVVDLDAVRKVPDTCTIWGPVGMSDNYDTVTAINQFLALSVLYLYVPIIHQLHWQSGTVDNSRTDDNW